ncbi:hypothetical protein NDU88_001459 [Pleurodeles waltl]|uniref:Uncharacterized protein n=1 Tax=Pleurodeles waltl TaxID=8319 RepID=A0AAV7WID9_PLEWA|nr:hypothetical protein NDU88_001459 [Pleurodeles waltl]
MGPAPSGDGVEPSAQTRKALKWDYSGTNLMSTAEAHTFEAQENAAKRADELVCSSVSNTGDRHTDSEMLQSIYDSIKELQTETRAESRRARMATKLLQGTVRKVVKSCAEIEEKLCLMEERTTAVEKNDTSSGVAGAERPFDPGMLRVRPKPPVVGAVDGILKCPLILPFEAAAALPLGPCFAHLPIRHSSVPCLGSRPPALQDSSSAPSSSGFTS